MEWQGVIWIPTIQVTNMDRTCTVTFVRDVGILQQNVTAWRVIVAIDVKVWITTNSIYKTLSGHILFIASHGLLHSIIIWSRISINGVIYCYVLYAINIINLCMFLWRNNVRRDLINDWKPATIPWDYALKLLYGELSFLLYIFRSGRVYYCPGCCAPLWPRVRWQQYGNTREKSEGPP